MVMDREQRGNSWRWIGKKKGIVGGGQGTRKEPLVIGNSWWWIKKQEGNS